MQAVTERLCCIRFSFQSCAGFESAQNYKEILIAFGGAGAATDLN